ncbi:hypothetical protein [Dictyobacter kobayashii]|nr:hypothetical protein [Dictyobacter kobayashii]
MNAFDVSMADLAQFSIAIAVAIQASPISTANPSVELETGNQDE